MSNTTPSNTNVIAVTFGVNSTPAPAIDISTYYNHLSDPDTPITTPLRPIIDSSQQVVPLETDIDDDVNFAKQSLRDITNQAKQVALSAAENAVMTGMPESVETYAILMKSIVDAAKALADTAEKQGKRKAQAAAGTLGEGDAPKTTNQNLFIGSTKDLQQALKDKKKETEHGAD